MAHPPTALFSHVSQMQIVYYLTATVNPLKWHLHSLVSYPERAHSHIYLYIGYVSSFPYGTIHEATAATTVLTRHWQARTLHGDCRATKRRVRAQTFAL